MYLKLNKIIFVRKEVNISQEIMRKLLNIFKKFINAFFHLFIRGPILVRKSGNKKEDCEIISPSFERNSYNFRGPFL